MPIRSLRKIPRNMRGPTPSSRLGARRLLSLLMLSSLALPLIGCASFMEPESFLTERQIDTPSAERMTICTGEV